MSIVTLLRNSGLPMSILLPRMHLSKKPPCVIGRVSFKISAFWGKGGVTFCLLSENN